MVTLAVELPFAAVVSEYYLDSYCSSCFVHKTDRALSLCIGCNVVRYCGKGCQKKDWIDHKHECSFLKNSSPENPPATCRLIARIAMKLKRPDAQKPAFNGTVFDEMKDYNDEIMKDPERMKTFEDYSRILSAYMGEKLVPDTDLLMSIYGKVVINSVPLVGDSVDCGQGLYLGLSVHKHNCIPDAHVISDGVKATLRSSDPNKKYSKDLTVSNSIYLQTNADRKQVLSRYYINCACALCSDPTRDFLCNSACSTCCPESYCLLDPDATELTCNKCGSISEITVEKAVAANEKIRIIGENSMKDRSANMRLQLLIETYEEFSKILSPMNVNLLLISDRLVKNAMQLSDHRVASKYVVNMVPTYRHYLKIGDRLLSKCLITSAVAMSYQNPPTAKVLKLFEEAVVALSFSYGLDHPHIRCFYGMLSNYRNRLKLDTLY